MAHRPTHACTLSWWMPQGDVTGVIVFLGQSDKVQHKGGRQPSALRGAGLQCLESHRAVVLAWCPGICRASLRTAVLPGAWRQWLLAWRAHWCILGSRVSPMLMCSFAHSWTLPLRRAEQTRHKENGCCHVVTSWTSSWVLRRQHLETSRGNWVRRSARHQRRESEPVKHKQYSTAVSACELHSFPHLLTSTHLFSKTWAMFGSCTRCGANSEEWPGFGGLVGKEGTF